MVKKKTTQMLYHNSQNSVIKLIKYVSEGKYSELSL